MRYLLGILVALAAPIAIAQTPVTDAPTVEAVIDRDTVYLGDSFTYAVRVVGADTVTPPNTLADLEDAEAVRRGTNRSSSTQRVFENGRAQIRTVTQTDFTYAVTPQRTGRLTIPGQAVTVDGRVLRTNLIEVTVLEPEESDEAQLIFTLSESEVFVGQQVDFNLLWSIEDATGVSQLNLARSQLPDGVEPVLPPLPPLSRRNPGTNFAIRLFGDDTAAQQRRGRGPNSVEIAVDGALRADRPGTYTFDRILAVHDRSTGRFNRDAVRKQTRADPITLTVKPVPEEGKPVGFNGLIGTYALTASADPVSVNVGDPITLRVEVVGREPMQRVDDGPDLSAVPGFEDFKLSPDGWTARLTQNRPGRQVFETTLRAASDEPSEIPAITLPYFDPRTGTYRTASSSPIPISVRQVKEVTAADAMVAAGTISNAAPREESFQPLRPNGPGLWAIETGPSVLASRRFDPAVALDNPASIAAVAAPPLLCLAALGAVAAHRRRDPAATRRRRALADALKALAVEGPGRAAQTYLAAVFDRPATAVTRADAERLLGTDHFATSRALATLLDAAEAERFGGAAPPPDRSSTAAALREADREIRAAFRSPHA